MTEIKRDDDLYELTSLILYRVLQQARLFPHLASAYAVKIFSQKYCEDIANFQMKLIGGEDRIKLDLEGMEFHALSSAAKPLCSWIVRDAIQDCRESCGGHGYLKSA